MLKEAICMIVTGGGAEAAGGGGAEAPGGGTW